MYDLYELAKGYEELSKLDFLYELENGHKFKLAFPKANFHHLIGLHNLRDVHQVSKKNRNVSYIFDRVLDKEIAFDDICKSKDIEKIRNKIKYFGDIKGMICCDTIRKHEKNIKLTSIKGQYVFCQRKQRIMSKPIYDYISLIIDIDFKNKDIFVPITFIIDPTNIYSKGQIIKVVDLQIKENIKK